MRRQLPSNVATFQILKYFLLLYKVLGLFPLSLDPCDNYSRGAISLVYSWLTTGLVAFVMYLSIVKRSWAVLSKIDSTLPTLMGYLEQTALFLTIFIIFYKSLTNLSTQLRKIMLNLLHVDSYLLRVLGNADPINHVTRLVIRKFFTYVSVYLLTNCLFFIYKVRYVMLQNLFNSNFGFLTRKIQKISIILSR